jgi:hypothetical protein
MDSSISCNIIRSERTKACLLCSPYLASIKVIEIPKRDKISSRVLQR